MPPAVIFDLDGTLTVRNLDFDAIRAEIGLPPGPILEALSDMPPDQRTVAERILDHHERVAAETATLHAGAAETVGTLRDRAYAVAILTRNTQPNARRVLDRFDIHVDAIRTREDGDIKPDPGGVLHLCERFNAAPADSWMVGDYLFDIQAGHGAGLKTVLMIADAPPPDYADRADHVIRRLEELLDLVDPTENI